MGGLWSGASVWIMEFTELREAANGETVHGYAVQDLKLAVCSMPGNSAKEDGHETSLKDTLRRTENNE